MALFPTLTPEFGRSLFPRSHVAWSSSLAKIYISISSIITPFPVILLFSLLILEIPFLAQGLELQENYDPYPTNGLLPPSRFTSAAAGIENRTPIFHKFSLQNKTPLQNTQRPHPRYIPSQQHLRNTLTTNTSSTTKMLGSSLPRPVHAPRNRIMDFQQWGNPWPSCICCRCKWIERFLCNMSTTRPRSTGSHVRYTHPTDPGNECSSTRNSHPARKKVPGNRTACSISAGIRRVHETFTHAVCRHAGGMSSRDCKDMSRGGACEGGVSGAGGGVE